MMDRSKLGLAALVDQKWGIAKDGKQICFIPEDLKRFQALTLGSAVIMGRKTFDAIGHPLRGRRNIVLSRTMEARPGVEVVRSIAELSPLLSSAWVIGGEEVYRQLLPQCDLAYITQVLSDLGADQFAPNLDKDSSWCRYSSTDTLDAGHVKYRFLTYKRIGGRS